MPIAFESSGTATTTVGSISFSYNNTGDLLLLGFMISDNGNPGTVQYGGVNMTKLGSIAARDAATGVWMYGQLAPTLGANNVVINTADNNTVLRAIAAGYSGVVQTGLPDAVGSTRNTGTVSSLAGTVTTVLDNCFVSTFCYGNTNGSMTAAAGATQRVTVGTGPMVMFMDSGTAITPPGLKVETVTMVTESTVESGLVIVSFAPFIANSISGYKSLLGVGQG